MHEIFYSPASIVLQWESQKREIIQSVFSELNQKLRSFTPRIQSVSNYHDPSSSGSLGIHVYVLAHSTVNSPFITWFHL